MPVSLPTENKLKASKSTKSGEAVLEAVSYLNHATAQEIYAWMKSRPNIKPTSLTSIYRALSHLAETTQVKPIHFKDGQVHYELNTQDMHYHHFYCTRCGKIDSIGFSPYTQQLEALRKKVHIQYYNFKVYGLCESCNN